MPVPEDMRHTQQVKLRLKPEDVALMDLARSSKGKGRSEWISDLIQRAAKRLGLVK